MSMDAGLVGHWKFNEKSGIIANDSSRYRNTGTLVGATHLPVWADKGIKFDGVDDYVDAGNNASLNITQAITVSAWVKSNVPKTVTIVGNNDGTNGTLLYIRSSAPYIKFGVVGVFVDSEINIYDNNYHLLTGTYDHSFLSLYLDGNFVNRVAYSLDLNVPANTRIGQTPFTSGYFSGSIDEVRIYNRALSANEIKRHYEATKHNYI